MKKKTKPQTAKPDIWTPKDNAAALAEGWILSDAESRGILEIQRHDESGIFASDRAALSHVERMESKGSRLHRRALAAVGLSMIRQRKIQSARDMAEAAALSKVCPRCPSNKPLDGFGCCGSCGYEDPDGGPDSI